MTTVDEKILYDAIVERGEWLEDDGCCSRYSVDNGYDTLWVCNRCEEAIDDPTEHVCPDTEWFEDEE
jgi:hypothetical protein